MFWNAPPSPWLRNTPLRTSPLRTGGRLVMMGGLFMGQASTNRLDSVSIPAIVGRIQIHPGVQAYLETRKTPPVPVSQGGQIQSLLDRYFADKPTANFPPMTDAERQILIQVSQNPSTEELQDLAQIDHAFNQEFEEKGYTTTHDVCYLVSNPRKVQIRFKGSNRGKFFYSPPQTEATKNEPPSGQSSYYQTREIVDPGFPGLLHFFGATRPDVLESELQQSPQWERWQGLTQGASQEPQVAPDTSFVDNKFYCQDMDVAPSIVPFTSRFGIDLAKPWGQIRQTVENAQILLDVHASYPFPPPIDMEPYLFWKFLADDLPKIANITQRVDPEAVRAWMTLATLQHYNDIANQIQEEAAARARAARRRAWLTFGISLIASIIVPFLLPSVLVIAITAIKTIITTLIDANERAKAARQLMDASKMFEKDAAKFSEEIRKTADMMDAAAAQDQANQPLTPDMAASIKDIEQGVPSTPIGTYVIGGVAATGLIAALVTLLR